MQTFVVTVMSISITYKRGDFCGTLATISHEEKDLDPFLVSLHCFSCIDPIVSNTMASRTAVERRLSGTFVISWERLSG